ncbi:MAG: DUF484 family protein [Litoreibacter sp.]
MSGTSEQAEISGEFLRNKILADPDLILEDASIMKALIAANDQSLGGNIIDLRGIAMERLEGQLDRLENTHKTVIAAAYDNLSGAKVIQNAVLKIMEPLDFKSFLSSLDGDLKQSLGVYAIRLVLESRETDATGVGFDDVLKMVTPGTVQKLISAGKDAPVRSVTLRQVSPGTPALYNNEASDIRSEALLKLDLGEGHLPGLLILGSEDPHQFRPNQGTDLLTFFGGAFERALRRWFA